MKSIILTISTAVSVLVLAGCSKEPLNNLTEEESRIYITNHDSTVNFGSYTTFSVADSVAVISNNRLEGKALTAYDAAIIAAVKAELQARGYTPVSKDANPDLGINISRVYNSSTGLISYPDYWGGYGGYWDPFYWGYGGYGYYFPTYYGSYTITEGALSIDALDLKDASADKQIMGVWNGLVRGTGIFRESNAAGQAKALFDQSAYFSVSQ
ncbi:MAG: DUF4136 domain-containing protein [Candidatus Pseudobacter hemicellulosilyticus]|uniref:DUF4136 domain-containing protein n=1 Tax=Candidatus Pseudobacter hemicellulosilyticus TaxID=3121375 RepID=A0AAJ6BIW7_9BACT|nr:MAG: DUF4136 domain-containing protein [Pseudobacter sp.]